MYFLKTNFFRSLNTLSCDSLSFSNFIEFYYELILIEGTKNNPANKELDLEVVPQAVTLFCWHVMMNYNSWNLPTILNLIYHISLGFHGIVYQYLIKLSNISLTSLSKAGSTNYQNAEKQYLRMSMTQKIKKTYLSNTESRSSLGKLWNIKYLYDRHSTEFRVLYFLQTASIKTTENYRKMLYILRNIRRWAKTLLVHILTNNIFTLGTVLPVQALNNNDLNLSL